MNSIPNQPPADELADVRAQLDVLKAREAELRNLMLTDASAREGNAWLAEIKEVNTTRVDVKEMRALHPALVAEFTFPAKVQHVVLVAITEDGELIPARKFRAATKEAAP